MMLLRPRRDKFTLPDLYTPLISVVVLETMVLVLRNMSLVSSITTQGAVLILFFCIIIYLTETIKYTGTQI